MIVFDYADIGSRLRGRQAETAADLSADCSMPSDRYSSYRNRLRYCGQLVHGVARTCDGSCHVA